MVKFSIVFAIGCLMGLMSAAGVRAEPLVRIQVDPDGGPLLLYWIDSGVDRIQRAALDGFFEEDVVTDLQEPAALFSGLTTLTHLQLRSARINSLPDDLLSGLTALEFLSLSHNDLTELPSLPASDNGYELVRSGDLPLVVIAAGKGVEIYPTELTMAEDDSDTYTVVLIMQPTAAA